MHLQRDSLSTPSTPTQSSGLEGLITTSDDGTILHLNGRACELLALDSSQALGKKLHRLFTFYSSEDISALTAEQTPFQIALKDSIHQEVVLGIAKDDTFKWFVFHITPLSEEDKTGLLVSFINVSKLVNQSHVLQDKQHQLQLLVASLNDLVFEVTDMGVFKNYWTNNPSLLFYPPEEFLNKSLTELFPADLAITTIQLIQKALKLDSEFKMEFQSPLEQQKHNWYSLQIKPIHRTQNRVALVVSDITKQIESTEKIRFNEHKFNQAFHFSGLGIALTNLDDYYIESNLTLTKILGYTQEEMSTMKFSQNTHPDDVERDIELRKKLIRGDIDSFTIQKRFRHKLGHFIWCSVTIAAVFENANTPLFLIVQVQDISESKKNIEILKRQKIESDLVKIDLESKVRQLEEFANILAHNLKGPLSNMPMLIDELKTSKDEKVRTNFLNLLKISSEQLNDTLHDLGEILDLHSNKSLVFKNCDFQRVYYKVKQQYIEEIQLKNATILTKFNVKHIHYPKIYLESILSNLISNSLRFTAADKAPYIEISTSLGEDGTLLTVKDNGLGINLPKYKSQLFMFKKVFHRGFESKGIGLFLTRYRVESLGGKIDVQSKPNEGSVFSVKFLERK